MGDFYLATSGDLHLAINEDFPTAIHKRGAHAEHTADHCGHSVMIRDSFRTIVDKFAGVRRGAPRPARATAGGGRELSIVQPHRPRATVDA